MLTDLVVVAAAEPPEPALALPAVFGDHMVLQRDIPLTVWGRGRPGEAIVVTVADRSAEATVDPDGRWSLQIEPLAAGREPVELRLRAQSGERTLRDVLVGDVWICLGQSNMGMGTKPAAPSGSSAAWHSRSTRRGLADRTYGARATHAAGG